MWRYKDGFLYLNGTSCDTCGSVRKGVSGEVSRVCCILLIDPIPI